MVLEIVSNITHKDFRALSVLHHAQGTPPWILKWVDWRALVKDLSPQLTKLK